MSELMVSYAITFSFRVPKKALLACRRGVGKDNSLKSGLEQLAMHVPSHEGVSEDKSDTACDLAFGKSTNSKGRSNRDAFIVSVVPGKGSRIVGHHREKRPSFRVVDPALSQRCFQLFRFHPTRGPSPASAISNQTDPTLVDNF